MASSIPTSFRIKYSPSLKLDDVIVFLTGLMDVQEIVRLVTKEAWEVKRDLDLTQQRPNGIQDTDRIHGDGRSSSRWIVAISGYTWISGLLTH